jgi:hypothetical protein
MLWRLFTAIGLALTLSACGGPTAPTRNGSLSVVVSPNPLPLVTAGNPIFYDVTITETGGVGVTLISDSARLVDAGGNVLPGALQLCYSGPGCPLPAVHIAHNLSFGKHGNALMVVSSPPDRLEYTINAIDDNNRELSVSVQVPVR